MRRGLILAALVLVMAMLALFFAVNVITSDQADVRTMHDLINDRRVRLSLGRLDIGPRLRDYAADRAAFMAKRGRLGDHDPCFGCWEVTGSTGYDNPGPLFRAWIRSDVHRFILSLDGLDVLGCGKARAGGIDWWACELRP